ncbi:ester cyclase [Sulfurimonas marina]|uniref:Ester cyclase n=1 Tax=Sulfurimonas marina TaxID=2590551 RepID=A0A7M1AUQ9_9BACT|nr:ester cyclase [Sulfurimonas marina]QOP41116.1 ester cyclase [Sulfurimonas marina]
MLTNKELIRKYYDMWNKKEFDKASEILDENISFRGSLDITAHGLDEFKEYATMLTTAFGDLYHAVEITVVENSLAAVYVTYTGKHIGTILGCEATKNKFNYTGAAFFQFRNSKIVSINVLGDLNSLYKQLH